MALQRDSDSLPNFDKPELDKPEDWAKNYPALKIHSSGRSLLFMYVQFFTLSFELDFLGNIRNPILDMTGVDVHGIRTGEKLENKSII